MRRQRQRPWTFLSSMDLYGMCNITAGRAVELSQGGSEGRHSNTL